MFIMDSQESSCALLSSLIPPPLHQYFTVAVFASGIGWNSFTHLFLGLLNVLFPRRRKFPSPIFPSSPPLSLSQTTLPLKMVYRGQFSNFIPSNGE
ncbi:hypothetical protein CKAH01_02483 [Colletotrichum kahawae]|uniref:Uncharacterized protein n=1 Tax=Colletotrichum kahawae TaxID=34407 RepID=A0AAE0CXX7_COLKA|nr:hypothetical protein CKAH01_02483 [Colletotrichum kahawae]